MTGRLNLLLRDMRGAAAAEMAMVLPLLIIIMFGSMELGNYFMQEHVVVKQVRNGARFASRLSLSSDYSCPTTIFDADKSEEETGLTPDQQIINVTRTGRVDGSGTARFAEDAEPCGDASAVAVTYRCADSDEFGGIYTALDGDVPVVKVAASYRYDSLFNKLGFDATNLCVTAESEVPVAGL